MWIATRRLSLGRIMKKTYKKPVLVKAGALPFVTARCSYEILCKEAEA